MWGNTLNLGVSKSIEVYKLFITSKILKIAKLKNKTKGNYFIKIATGLCAFIFAGGLYSTANDPETANDPQNGPQMILDRK